MTQVEIHEQDRKADGPPSVPSSIHDSGESGDDTADEDDEPAYSASQDEEPDADGVMPDELSGSHSPIDDLKSFDWGGAEDELAEFMGSDSDDSDSSSIASDSDGSSRRTPRGTKRHHGEGTEDEDSDRESVTAKKRHQADARPTGLHTVKTPNSAQSESSLPTPRSHR